MSLTSALLLGLALAVDCFAVSLCLGMQVDRLRLGRILLPPVIFGSFQWLMPLLGWGLGLTVRSHIEAVDHWFAFVLLLGVGAHMLKEAWEQRQAAIRAANGNACATCPDLPLKSGRPIFALLSLGLATSLDALAVGLGMAFAEISLWTPALLIGCATFTVSLTGMLLGHGLGRFVRGTYYAVALGGGVLIGLGLKILVEHGVFG